MNESIVLETTRLLLRPITLNDNDYILAQLNDPGWLQFIGDRNIHSSEEARTYIADKILAHIEKTGQQTFFVIMRKDDPEKKIVGQCGLFEREGLDKKDLGFAFLEDYCGNGYGSEAAAAVLAYAEKKLAITDICAITAEENIPSQKLLNKLGMTYKETITLPNIDGLCMYYEL